MKSIAVFNNKGGVGKTTLLCNLASYLKSQGNRVLVIDADPQCNASIYLLDFDLLSKILLEDQSTIKTIFEPVKNGEGYISIDRIPIHQSDGFLVDVIVGDPKLSLLEDFLSEDWFDGANGQNRGLKTTLLMYDLLLKLRDKYDYVFFDIGPSLGALNRVVLLSCDYFLMPMSTDIFSLQAVANIAESIKNWKKGLDRGLNDYRDKENKAFLIGDHQVDIKLSFIGYVTQQYIAKSVSGEVRPVKAYDKIIVQIPETIQTQLADLFPAELKDELCLGNIPNYNSLIPLSQMANKPIFRLASADGVVGAHFTKVKDYELVIQSISNRLIENIQKYDTMA